MAPMVEPWTASAANGAIGITPNVHMSGQCLGRRVAQIFAGINEL